MRRFSRATKKKSTTILICVLVIGIAFGLAFFFSVRQIKNRYEAENLAIQNQLDSVQNMVYVATKDILLFLHHMGQLLCRAVEIQAQS